jgi:hypothetical protein
MFRFRMEENPRSARQAGTFGGTEVSSHAVGVFGQESPLYRTNRSCSPSQWTAISLMKQ